MTSKPTNALVKQEHSFYEYDANGRLIAVDQDPRPFHFSADDLEHALNGAKLLPPHQYKLARIMCYITLITLLVSALMTINMAWVSTISWAVCFVVICFMCMIATQVWREQFN